MNTQKSLQIAETTSVIVAGLGMMMLIVVGSWLTAVYALDTQQVAREFIGNSPRLSMSEDEVIALGGQFDEPGQVAGVVDDSSQTEESMRNSAAAWLNEARYKSGLSAMYRDSVLDRQAQNHARSLADACSSDAYNDWEDLIGTKIDEGTISGFSEAAFLIQDDDYSNNLPQNQPSYERLFTLTNAYGIGVAAIPERTAPTCSAAYVLTVHLADVQ